MANRWRTVSDLTDLGFEPQTFRSDSDVLTTKLIGLHGKIKSTPYFQLLTQPKVTSTVSIITLQHTLADASAKSTAVLLSSLRM